MGEGFPNDLYKYKTHRNAEQRRREEFKAAFKEMYEEKRRKEQEEQENLVVPSSAGSVDQEESFGKFPVDSITGPTRCKLFVPVAKGAFKIEVASGMVYPERLWHGKPVPHAYVRVTADMVHANTVDCKLDFPTPDTEIDTLREAQNEFILWAHRDITLEGHVPAQIQQTLQPVLEQHDPLSSECQVALPTPSPATEPPHAPNPPEQELT